MRTRLTGRRTFDVNFISFNIIIINKCSKNINIIPINYVYTHEKVRYVGP